MLCVGLGATLVASVGGCAPDDEFEIGSSGFHVYETTPDGVRATGTVARDQELMLEFVPPANATQISVTLQGDGDADLYTRFDVPPTLESYSCRPYIGGSNEECNHNAARPLFVKVRGFAETSNFAVIVKGISTSP
jgi:hypothetical protein